jgi:hypothetical protein
MTGKLISLSGQHPPSESATGRPQAITLPAPAGWPAPPEQAAYHGLPGAIVQRIAPHTEADRATRGRTFTSELHRLEVRLMSSV